MAEDSPSTAQRIECPTCGNTVPPGAYCGACGGTLGAAAGPRDQSAYAAHPHEHVVRPWIATTLFPYLPHRSLTPYRLALFVGTATLAILALLRLTGPALTAGAVLVPVLYLVYLFEAGVYEDQPWLVTLAVLVIGAVLGIAWALWLAPLATQALVSASSGQLGPIDLIWGAVIVPLSMLALTLVGPALLFVSGRFRDALDGFTFGAASALGFSLAATMTGVVALIGDPSVSSADPFSFTLDALRRGVLAPFVGASLSGLVGAAFWLRRQPAGLRERSLMSSPAAMLAIAIAVDVALGLIDITFVDARIQLVAWLVATVLLVVIVRVTLHAVLLSEANTVTVGPPTVCPHCLQQTPFMAFCPNCGIARRATPKIGRYDLRADRVS